MLAQRLDQAAAQDKQRGRVQAATRREVIRRVEDKIQQRVAGDDAERLERELYERLDAPDFEEGLDDRPVEEIITDLCHDLGVDNPHNLKAWKRRSPRIQRRSGRGLRDGTAWRVCRAGLALALFVAMDPADDKAGRDAARRLTAVWAGWHGSWMGVGILRSDAHHGPFPPHFIQGSRRYGGGVSDWIPDDLGAEHQGHHPAPGWHGGFCAEPDCGKGQAGSGFTLQMTALDTDAVAQKAVTQPRSYDVADIEYFLCKKIFPTGVLQPMDTKRIKQYGNIVPIFTTGKLTPTSTIGQGTAPHTVSFVEGPTSTKFSSGESGWMTLIPTIYNADTLGIRPDLIGRPISHWKDLVDPAFKGRASILNIPGIGIMDAAMVMESLGTMKYADKGNMTKEEIDKTVGFLIDTKQSGQFRAFWKSFDESVNLMAAGEVVIQSMWSPAVTAVRSRGIACTYQPLEEGYRVGRVAWALPSI